ncbi:MAG: hypothetical protein HY757_01705 [Nitrospirae bacterium]|nr:hypothetical protein [Nitrospirota bacterium]
MIKPILKFVSVLAFFLCLALAQPCVSDAEVNIDINISPPAFFPIPAPPAVLVIPGSYVYFVPDIDIDIFFYQGYWYRPHRDIWYSSKSYNGPWAYVLPKRLPPPILNVPPGFRHLPPKHDRIPHKELERNWKSWEKKKHWDKDRGESKGKGKHGKKG